MHHAGGVGTRFGARAVAWLVLALSGLGLAWAAASALPDAARRFSFAPDATLEARPLPKGEHLEAWLELRAREIASRRAFLGADSEQVETSFAELGLALDVEATRALVHRLPRPTGAWNQLTRALQGPPREVPRLEPVIRFDPERALVFLAKLSALNREPEDARLDLAQHQRVEAWPGRELLLPETLGRVAGGARAEDTRFELAFRELPAKVTLAMLPAVDVSQVLGRYETDFRGHAGARAVNIRRAARFLDRVVVEPGATFSFNRTVGPRSAERGFVKAPVIVNDETEPGLGGGVCQVATTLHAAAVFAGLQVLERRSHSRPSGYAPLGLDATVIEDKVDFRFRNPFDTAVMLHTAFPRSTSIRVEILGHEPLGKVEHAARVIERYPFSRRLVEKAELAAGSFEQKQKGGYGYDIVSVVSLTRADGTVATRRYPSKYYPVPEVLWIGKGTEATALPPLPDGATGLEVP
jgi:vancomycin resistance protein YoaR